GRRRPGLTGTECTMPAVQVDRRGSATWITLDAPERLNAFDPPMSAEIVAALHSAGSSRAVVITGRGRGFCAGGALGQLSAPTVPAMRELYRSSLALLDAIRQCP